MSKCQIEMELKGNPKAYERGGKIFGQVLVSVDKAVTCKALDVSLVLYSHGRGNRESQIFQSELIYKGDWEPGSYIYDFCVDIGSCVTPTSHGRYVNVDWKLVARADIPWALDPKAETRIIINRAMSEHGDSGAANRISESKKIKGLDTANLGKQIFTSLIVCGFLGYFYYANPSDYFTLILVAGIFLVPNLMKVIQILLQYLSDGTKTTRDPGLDMGGGISLLQVFLATLGLCVVLMAGYFLYLYMQKSMSSLIFLIVFGLIFFHRAIKKVWNSLRNALANGRIGRVHCHFGGSRFLPNQKIPFSLKFKPRQSVLVNQIEVLILAKEVAISGSGTNRSYHRNTLVSESHSVLAAETIQRGRELVKELEIQMPTYAPASFNGSSNSITWSIKVSIDIEGWPDWVNEQNFEMV